MTDITIKEGTTRRYLHDATAPGGGRYNFTNGTIDLIIKTSSSQATPELAFHLAIDNLGATTFTAEVDGVAMTTPAARLFLGRPDPANLSGPLINTTAAEGYITTEFMPEDSEPLATTSTKKYIWAIRVRFPNIKRVFILDEGICTVEDSPFDQ